MGIQKIDRLHIETCRFLVGVSLKDLSFPVTIYQIEAQRSGFDWERKKETTDMELSRLLR